MYVCITISVHMWYNHFLTITNDICSVHIRQRHRSSRTSLGYTSCTVWGPSGVCHGTALEGENSMGSGKCELELVHHSVFRNHHSVAPSTRCFNTFGRLQFYWPVITFFWGGATAPGPNSLISPALIHSSAQAMNNWISGCIYVWLCLIMYPLVI